MANAAQMTEGDYGMFESGRYEVEDGLKITLPFEVKEGSVLINGLEEDDAAAEGKFAVAVTAATAQAAGSTVITLAANDATKGQTVRVGYQRRIVSGAKVEVKTTSTTAKGSLYAHWPLYSSGLDCTEAGIKGILHLHIYRVRATALPGFSNSYKSAA